MTFQRAAERSCGYVIDVFGDLDITAYTKADANAFRDDLLKRKLTGSSITRVFGTVRSIINFASSEIGIEITNPFGKVYYDRTAGVEDREPIPSTPSAPCKLSAVSSTMICGGWWPSSLTPGCALQRQQVSSRRI